MDINLDLLLTRVYSAGSLLMLYMLIFFAANILYSKLAGYNVKDEVVKKDNIAVSVALAGYLLAISIIFVGCVLGPSNGLLQDLLDVLKYSALGMALLYIAHLVNDKLILHKFNNAKELVEDKNVGTGAVLAGSYIASGLIVAGSIHGEGGGVASALVFFVLGQLSLVLFTKVYDVITSYDLHEEVEKCNYAAGIAFAGTLTALGVILSKAAGGDFVSWQFNISYFMLNAAIAFILLPVFRIFIDKLVITDDDLNREIAEDKNIGAGFLEFGATVGFAVVLFFVI